LGSTDRTALVKDSQAFLGLEVSVKYVQGGENRDGFLTEDVETPFSVADTRVRRPSALLERKSPRHVTCVRVGSENVLQPLLPADVGKDCGGCCGGDIGGFASSARASWQGRDNAKRETKPTGTDRRRFLRLSKFLFGKLSLSSLSLKATGIKVNKWFVVCCRLTLAGC